jgi:hypothetical protein
MKTKVSRSCAAIRARVPPEIELCKPAAGLGKDVHLRTQRGLKRLPFVPFPGFLCGAE